MRRELGVLIWFVSVANDDAPTRVHSCYLTCKAIIIHHRCIANIRSVLTVSVSTMYL
jgi:hypothetical protein